MFTLFKKRASYLKGKPEPNTSDADFHKKLAEHHSAISAEHAKMAGVEHEKPVDEEESPYGPTEEEGAEPFLLDDEYGEKPPDTIESAKNGPPENEEEETPAHEAGESVDVEAIEESKKPSFGLPDKEGHSLRNSDKEHEPLSRKGGRSFRPFGKKSGGFKP